MEKEKLKGVKLVKIYERKVKCSKGMEASLMIPVRLVI